MRNIPLKLFICFMLLAGRSQAQYYTTDKTTDEVFTFKVKTVDEFIERFNDEDESFIRKEYKKQKRTGNITRSKLLFSLLNLQNPALTGNPDLKDFFYKVLDSTNPQYINFTDSNWYAEAVCVFKTGGKSIEIPLILHIHSEGEKGSKWMITGLGNDSFFNTGRVASQQWPAPVVNTKFISTSSNSTNFVELSNVFSHKIEPAYYFEPEVLGTERASYFIKLIQEGKMHFEYCKSIKYTFFQVPGWKFTVDQLVRTSTNSGWLINELRKMSDSDKALEIRKLNHLQ